jgi:hypothetical protein
MPLRMARKTEMMHSQCSPKIGDGKSHTEQVISALERTRSISCTAIAAEAGTFTESVYCILNNSLGKGYVCAKWIPHVLNDDKRAMRVFLATTHLLRLRNEGHAFLHRILTVDESWMHSFDPQLK